MSHYTLHFSWHIVTVVGALQLVQLCFARSFCSIDLASKSLKPVYVLGRSRDDILFGTTNTEGSNWVCCGPKGVTPPAMRLRGGAAKQTSPSAESVPAGPPAKPGRITKAAKNAPSKEESQEAPPAKPVKATKAASKAKAAPARTESPDAATVKPAKTAKSKAKSKNEDAYSVIQFSTIMLYPANGFQLLHL